MLQQSKLLVIDEYIMLHNHAVEALVCMLRDLRNKHAKAVGGFVVLLAVNFRETLPIITKGTPANKLNLCFKLSCLWDSVLKTNLPMNMRVQIYQQESLQLNY